MEHQQLLSHCDHTILRPEATWEQVQAVCDQGIKGGCASVCIPMSYVEQASNYVAGRIPVCTVIGFPNGYTTTSVKIYEAQEAVRLGATEIDMVVNLGWVKDCRWDDILMEIQSVEIACQGNLLKVIVETCLLTEEEKIKLCYLVTEGGAQYIKTSTGFSTGGATREDVALLAQHIGQDVKIKASGGIRTLQDGYDFVALGADRLGTSSLIHQVFTD